MYIFRLFSLCNKNVIEILFTRYVPQFYTSRAYIKYHSTLSHGQNGYRKDTKLRMCSLLQVLGIQIHIIAIANNTQIYTMLCMQSGTKPSAEEIFELRSKRFYFEFIEIVCPLSHSWNIRYNVIRTWIKRTRCGRYRVKII